MLLVGLHVFKPSDAFDKVSLSPIQQDFSPVTNFKYWNSNKYNCRNNHRQSSKCNTAEDKQHKDTGATKIHKDTSIIMLSIAIFFLHWEKTHDLH